VGAVHVAQRCAEIEALARRDRVMPAETVLDALDGELDGATRALRALAGRETRVA